MVIFYLMEWVELRFGPTTLRLEVTDEGKETGASLSIELILELVIFRQVTTDACICNRKSFTTSTYFKPKLNCARKVS